MAFIKETLKKIYYKPYIQNPILKCISPIFPEYENRLDAETRFGIWKTTSHLFQVEGRQLGEGNVHQGLRHRHFPIQYHECKISGSRKGKETNLSALQDIMRNFEAAMIITVTLREHFIETLSLNSDPFTAAELFMFSQHVVSLPLYQYRFNNLKAKQKKPVDLQLTAVFQIVAGVFESIKKALRDSSFGLTIDSSVDPEMLYQYIEEKELFSTPDPDPDPSKTKVCGGAKSKVIELMDVLINGSDKYLPNHQSIASRNVDIDNFLNYSLTALMLDLMVKFSRLESARKLMLIDLNSNIDNLDSYRQLFLDSEFSVANTDPFLNDRLQKEARKDIEYRMTFIQSIFERVQEARCLLLSNDQINVNYKESHSYKLQISSEHSNTLYKTQFDLKRELLSDTNEYLLDVIKLQKCILHILNDNREANFSHRSLIKLLTIA